MVMPGHVRDAHCSLLWWYMLEDTWEPIRRRTHRENVVDAGHTVLCSPEKLWIRWAQISLLEKEMQPTPVLLPGWVLHGWRRQVGYSPWDRTESDTTEQLHFVSFYSSFWRRKWQPTPGFLPGESHGQRGLVGYTLWGCKELDMTEQLTHTHRWVFKTL